MSMDWLVVGIVISRIGNLASVDRIVFQVFQSEIAAKDKATK